MIVLRLVLNFALLRREFARQTWQTPAIGSDGSKLANSTMAAAGSVCIKAAPRFSAKLEFVVGVRALHHFAVVSRTGGRGVALFV